MDLHRIDKIAFEHMGKMVTHHAREPGWLYFHGKRTANIACWLSDQISLPVNREVLWAGALFHDIGKGQEPHNEVGENQTRDLLKSECSSDELDEICIIVLLHSQMISNDLKLAEVKIVQDADRLDHVGPIVPWLSFYWRGVHHETVDNQISYIRSEENLTYQKTIRSRLHFDFSKDIFDKRLEWETDFFNKFHNFYYEGISWD